MAGKNILLEVVTKSLKQRSQGQPCVFISHRKLDANAAKAVALYLQGLDIDIYLDEFDLFLPAATAAGDASKIVKYIEMGIDISTHLLGIISPNTKGSWWVPFEIGSARQKHLPVAYLLLDNVDYLPEYLQITKHISDQLELSNWVREEMSQKILLERKSISSPNIPGLPFRRAQAPRFVNS